MPKHGSLTRLWMAGVCALAAAAAGCGRSQQSSTAGESPAHVGAAGGEKYPAPRWPSYFKTPKSIDDLMPAARMLVRNQSGLQGKGMGILQPGEKVLIVAADEADQMVIEAIKRALEERKITPYFKYTRSGPSYFDMSLRITLSPGWSPLRISI